MIRVFLNFFIVPYLFSLKAKGSTMDLLNNFGRAGGKLTRGGIGFTSGNHGTRTRQSNHFFLGRPRLAIIFFHSAHFQCFYIFLLLIRPIFPSSEYFQPHSSYKNKIIYFKADVSNQKDWT